MIFSLLLLSWTMPHLKKNEWELVYVDKYCATTTIRLWHEIYTLKKIPHDFEAMLSPKLSGFYIGLAKYNEIRAIANCNEYDSNIRIGQIAYAPEQIDAPTKLIRFMNEANSIPDWSAMRKQPRWYYEQLYLLESESDCDL